MRVVERESKIERLKHNTTGSDYDLICLIDDLDKRLKKIEENYE